MPESQKPPEPQTINSTGAPAGPDGEAVNTEAAGRIAHGYDTDSAAVTLGSVVVDGACDALALVRIPLATFNRHGLVAGATGTGKTKTLQLLAEQLSTAGVPVMMPDVKGDLSGLAVAGEPGDRITQRASDTGDDWRPLPIRSSTWRWPARDPACRCAPPSTRSAPSCCRRCWASTTPRNRRWV